MKTTKSVKTPKNSVPVINNIIIRPTRRTTQDIGTWRNAMVAAEAELPRRILLYDLYEDLLLDGHLQSIIDKRIMAVTNSPLMFTVNKKEIDEISELQEKGWFETLVAEMLNAKFWGHSLVEFFYDNNGNLNNELVPRKNVEHKAGLILKQQGDTTGENYRDNAAYKPWLMEAGSWKNLGRLLQAAQYVIYKRGNFGDWAQYAELFGMPWKIAKYNSYDPQARQDLEKALEEAGGNANIVIPEGTEIDLKYGTASGNGDLYDKLKNACNEQLSVLILGQTMTTNDTRGSGYAQGKIHEAVEQEIHLNDRRYITRILNDQFNPILEMHGFKVSGGKWSYREEDNIELKKTKIGIDMQVAEKVPVADDYFYETYGIPKPENYDELKARQEAARTAPASLAQDPDPALEQNDKKKQDPKLSAKQGLLERVLSFFS